jgi:hypothetical protein
MDSKIEQTLSNETLLYKYDEEYQDKLLKEKPWTTE